jgi:hypothetical protein
LGPFDNPKGADVSVECGPEKLVKRMKVGSVWPALAETFTGRAKAKLAWRVVAESEITRAADAAPLDTGTLDFHALLKTEGAAGDNAVAFLYRTLEVAAPLELELACGSDDGMRLWLDGELLLDRSVPRGLNPFEERVTLRLVPGANHLLVKVSNLGGAWSFAMCERRAATQTAINRAIDRGVARLLEQQLIDGSWDERRDDYPNGQTGLSVYTLLKCGLRPRHEAVLQALESLRAEPSTKTYSLACEILALAACHDPAYLPLLEERAARLISWQNSNGGWSYPDGQTDLSNTHLATFSLRAAAQAGVAIDAGVWNELASFAVRHQEARRKDGVAGFTYAPGHDTGQTGSMTCAGLALLAAAREQLGERMIPNIRLQVEPALEAGVAWLARHWTVTKNPNKPDYHLYYLYGIERVGALLGLERIGEHDWYSEGAEVLVGLQDAEGGWGGQADTCFALNFLRRATSLPLSVEKKDPERLLATPEGEGALRLRVRLGSPVTLWIEPPKLAPGLAVAALEFEVRGKGDVQTLTADAGTLATRHLFECPGEYTVQAKARLSDGASLASSVLHVRHEDGLDPRRVLYPTDPGRNRLPAQKPTVTASSALEPAANACDGKVWTRWLCQASDREPWIELDPPKAFDAARILLSPARASPVEARQNARPTRLELWINKDKAPRVVNLAQNPLAKTVVEFDPPVALSRLKLRITALEGGELGKAAVGLGEIEVQVPGKR